MARVRPSASRPAFGALALRPATVITAVALLIVAAAAWAQLLWPESSGALHGMSDSDTGSAGATMGSMDDVSAAELAGAGASFVAAWIVMMAAMMLPSAIPMVVLYRAMATGSPSANAIRTSVFVLGYLVAWGVFGVAVFAVQRLAVTIASGSPHVEAAWPVVVAGVLGAAGVYQFSALKDICLGRCRSPWSFLVERWRPGAWGGLELGVRHGVYCIGCCWGLMAVLVVAGAMGLAWVTLIAVVVFAEKLLPTGRGAARVVGLVLLGLAATVLAVPGLAQRLAA